MEGIFYLTIGLGIGSIIGYLIAYLRAQGNINRTQHESTRQSDRLEATKGDLETARLKLQTQESELKQLSSELAQVQERLRLEQRHAEEKITQLQNLQKELQDSFKALSSEALKSNNSQFLELAKETLSRFQQGAASDLEKRQTAITELVKPLSESLTKVDSKIAELEKAREGAYSGLSQQIKSLAITQNELQGETANLVKALRTPHVRGQWGELQLKRTVEFSGMIEHVDFLQQESTTTEEGRHQRPDLIVRLPNGKQIIVDAKAPLDAYLSALESKDTLERETQLKRHARQIRDHIKSLSSKKYWTQFEETPEFVVLFIPGEAFFSAALEQDPSLIEFGASENVIIATPTTLIALLKAVAYGWRQEQIASQAQAISDLGKELYERLVKIGDHFEKLGKTLERSVDSYNQAMRSFDTRVFSTARKFNHIAPISTKELSALPSIEKSPNPPINPEWNP